MTRHTIAGPGTAPAAPSVNVAPLRLDYTKPRLQLQLGLELLGAGHLRNHVLDAGDQRPIPPDLRDQPQHPARIRLLTEVAGQ